MIPIFRLSHFFPVSINPNFLFTAHLMFNRNFILRKTPTKKRATKVKKEDQPPKKKQKVTKKSTAGRKPSSQSAKSSPSKSVKEEDDEDDQHKWWLDSNKDDTVKWTTLEHQGPLFPPPYIPHNVKMKYDGEEVTLTPKAEEVASFYAALLETDHGNNPVFQKNFFEDFLNVIKEEKKPCPIKVFKKCDFTPIFEYLNKQKELRKQMTKEEKKKIKDEKAAIDEIYGFCFLDGRKEKVGNYRIEPPGLFRGRGEHPKTGCLKQRVTPEQVTLNIGADAVIPKAPEGHTWGAVSHDNKVTWLATWKENVNDNTKYIFLAATSSLKGQSDLKKFEKARELKQHIHRIRESYTADLKDKVMATRQLATSLYFIDKLALRAGNEKGEDEADTVGCCSLRYEHITLEPPNKVTFDFLGKDSIRYVNTVEVDEQVFKNIKLFKKAPKKEGDDLFDRINTSILNKHLSKLNPGLTAKVFRTFNASFTFQEELKKTPADGTVAEKILAYNRANREVAVLCNHQRAVPKTHGAQMEKMGDKILALKYQRKLVKDQMLVLDPKLRRKRPEISEPESDLDDEFIERHLVDLEEKEKERLEKALVKENEKRAAEGMKPLLELPESKSRKAPGFDTYNMERLEKKFTSLSERIAAQKMQLVDRDENKQTALGTSKINYIDPRISAAWCHKFDVPLEKIFNRSLREKFTWAMETEPDFEF
ncbi:hypothetical protein BC833DRAFT_603846 [Globomyces pollinis-pini]|nr:hypothetical protein BC833DRAFT_603846 [Globomyces pollinis-pini]